MVLFGELAGEIGKQAQKECKNLPKKADFIYVLDREELVLWLRENVKPGDAVLFKGSNSMGLHAVVREVFPESSS